MGLLVDPRLRAMDNSGNAISGATLTIYETGTTTPAEVYSTSALAEAGGAGDLANPVEADSAGYFDTIFIENEQVVDLILKDEDGVTIWESDGVTAVSGALSALALDFNTNGRLRYRGLSNVVRQEVGDPEGDDTGGDFVTSGWNATQLSTWTQDVAALTVTGSETINGSLDVDGTITGNNGKGIDIVYTAATLAEASNQDIALPSGYDEIELEIINLNISDATLSFRLSFDNGSSYDSGNNYVIVGAASQSAGAVYASHATGGASATTYLFRIFYKSGERCVVQWTGTAQTTANLAFVTGGMRYTGGTTKPSHIRFYAGAGTIAFRYVLRSRKQA